MKVAVTMRTADRSPGPNYLRRTLDNARRAGLFTSPHLAAFDIVTSHTPTPAMDRALSLAPSHVTVSRSARTLTPNECATEAHQVADRHAADYVLFLEDDLDFCNDFLGSVTHWLHDFAEPQYPLYVFGHVKGGGKTTPGARPYPVRGFYGTQCYAVPRHRHGQLVEWLSSNPHYENRALGGRAVPRCHDLRLHNWAQDLGCPNFLASTPSFVDHIGEVSGMGCKPVRFVSWPGRDWSYQGRKVA